MDHDCPGHEGNLILELAAEVGALLITSNDTDLLSVNPAQAVQWQADPHLQGMGRVRSGQAPAWPLVSDRSVRRGSRVKHDFACAFTRQPSPVLVVLRSQSCLRMEGRTRTLSGPSPDLGLNQRPLT